MSIEIPNWPLSSIEIFSVRIIITNWLLSFWKSKRQSLEIMNDHETLFLEF
ncbi:MAG: hypothetical protein Q7U04_16090 [Bacteriovorax sp.]|nr:hypothetical protein [Bacteriovorax sp.]